MKILSLTFSFLLLTFFSNAQLVVDDIGNVGVGAYFENNNTVLPGLNFQVSGRTYITGGASKGIDIETYAGDILLRGGFNNGGYLGKFDQRWGNIYTDKINGTTYVTSSDLAIKENIRPIEGASAKLMLVNPVIYDLKASFFEDPENPDANRLTELVESNKGTSGVIAQELQEIFPELVHLDEGSELLGVNYQGLIPYLIKALQEQQVVIDELKSKVDLLGLGE